MGTRATILDRWLARAVAIYGERVALHAATVNDPTRNLIGHRLRTNMSAAVDELLGGMGQTAIAKAFEEITALRAVQNVTIVQALSFVFDLRTIVREELPTFDERELEKRIDILSLAAFAEFLRCRERLFELRLSERLRELGPQYQNSCERRAESGALRGAVG